MPLDPGAAAASPTASVPEPAPAAAAAAAPASNRLNDLTPEQRHEWRKTGNLPDAPAASSTATAADEPPAGTPASPEPASELADDDPQYKPKTKARIESLLNEIKALKARPPAAAVPAAPVPAVPAPAAAASTLVKPDPDTFQYGTADPAYLEALTDYKVAKRFEDDAAARSKAERDTRISAEARRIQESWKSRVEKAKGTYADFEAIAFSEHSPIPQGSLMDSWILESEHGADLLYALHKNPAEIDRLLKLQPLAQTRELVALEQRLVANPPKLVTSAPEPGPTLSARAGDPASADPIKRAVKGRDFSAYKDAANEADLKTRRRK